MFAAVVLLSASMPVMKTWFVCKVCPMAANSKKGCGLWYNFKKCQPWDETEEGCRERLLLHLKRSSLHEDEPEADKLEMAAGAEVVEEQWEVVEVKEESEPRQPRQASWPRGSRSRSRSPLPERRRRTQQRGRTAMEAQEGTAHGDGGRTEMEVGAAVVRQLIDEGVLEERSTSSSRTLTVMPTPQLMAMNIVVRRQQLELIADVCRRAATAAHTAYRVATAAAAGFKAEHAVCDEAHDAVRRVLDSARQA